MKSIKKPMFLALSLALLASRVNAVEIKSDIATTTPTIEKVDTASKAKPLFEGFDLEKAKEDLKNLNNLQQSSLNQDSVSLDPKLEKQNDALYKENQKLLQDLKRMTAELARFKETMGVLPSIENPVAIPAVDSKVVTENVPKYQKTKTTQNDVKVTANDTDITVSPGVNQIVTIAVGHSNRIVTPFANPQVSSSTLTGGEGGEVSIKDNVVYISTNKTTPLSMFITDKGNENLAISLTLLPRKIPSREVHLSLNNSNYLFSNSNDEAKAWETSQPFVSGIKKTLKEIALQHIPSGYQLLDIPLNYKLPKCNIAGFKVEFANGQLIAGSKLHYLIGKITNVSLNTLEFIESSCGDYDVAAVAVWPNVVLKPGESSELYVVKHAPQNNVQQIRTSVLNK